MIKHLERDLNIDLFKIYEYKQGIMNNYITYLLSKKYKKYKEQTKEEFADKKNTGKYLNSCIVFIYDKQNRNIASFLNEIKKYELQDISCNYNLINFENGRSFSDLGKIYFINSNISGLGKSEKKIIKKENKKYFYFPIGGILSKNIIFNKLKNLLNRIKN